MHSHLAFFWLNDNLSTTEILEFEKGLGSLIIIPVVVSGFYGKPADTHRSVVENSYTYGLSLLFKEINDQISYQNHEIHEEFVKRHSSKWSKVQVFDIEYNMHL
jgi:hypothetical protein